MAAAAASRSDGGLTDEDRTCWERWYERTLPPTLEVAVPPDVGDQPMLRSIGVLDGEVVAMGGTAAYRLDLARERLEPVALPHCSSVLDLAENAGTLFAVCSRRRKLHVMSRPRGEDRRWEVVLEIPERRIAPRLAVSETAVVVAGAEALWWRPTDDPRWRTIALATPEPVRAAGFGQAPTVALLTTSTLFLGWDYGEFGGWLYRIELDSRGAPSGRPELVEELPVHSIAQAALGLDADGWPLLVAGDLGVFKIAGDGLRHLVEKRLVVSFTMKNGVVMSSHPVGIAATDRGFFVASRGLGVFAFVEDDEGYVLSHLVRR